MSTNPVYSKKDFASDQMVRWCPGCGDYSILAQVQTAFSELGIPREKFAVIAAAISRVRNGRPWIFGRETQSTRYSARSTFTS